MKTLGIAEAVREEALQRASRFPVRSNWASQIGDPCERFLVYMRTSWQERPAPDARLQMIFDMGKDSEIIVRKRLQAAGFEVIRDQEYVDLPAHQISGKIDGMIRDEFSGKNMPVEIKSASGYNFDKLAGADNLIEMMLGGARYMQRYPAQLLLYMYSKSNGQEWKNGVWVFFNKITGEIADRVVELEPWTDYCESLLKKADRINEHVKLGTLPERVNDWELCSGCDFEAICNPPKTESERVAIAESEMGDLLNERRDLKAEIKPTEGKIKKLDTRIKAIMAELPEQVEIVIADGWICKKGKTRWIYGEVE